MRESVSLCLEATLSSDPSRLKMIIPPAYVIHATDLSDRARHIQAELGRAGVPFEWILEHDAHSISAADDEAWFAPDADLTRGQKSCAMKHIAALQRVADAGHELALVFEDDAQLVPGFLERLQPILAEADHWPRPRILHLGIATNFYTPARSLRKGQLIYPGTRVRNMEAYALGAVEAKARLDWLTKNPMREPIDLAFNSGDPAMGIPFLWVEPPLAEQGSLNGKFPSTLDRKQRGQTKLRIQFAVQKFRRRRLKRWLKLWFR